MKRNILFFVPRQAIRCLWACMLPMLAVALLTGCSKVDDPDALPAGKYPINFTAAVDGLTVQKAGTRATTDGSWAGGEEVAVKIDSEVKKYTAAADGTLTVDGSNEPWYWQNTTEEKTASAWYPYSAAQPTSFSVEEDQSGNGYQNSDMIYAAPATISFHSNALTFRHLPVKVVVNLKNGEGVTADEVTNATVTIVNQNLTSGTIAANWSVKQALADTETIIPNALSSAASGFQKSVQALLVPQQMQNRKFIKVTIGTGDAARNYYYTPAAQDDANLESGKQYTYQITVKKTGLVVTVTNNGAQWNAGSTTTGGSEATTFKVKIPTVSGAPPTIEGTTGNTGEIYTTAGNSFSITLTVGDGMQGFNVKGGICDVKRVVENGNTYKFTYSNIRSNLELAYGEYIEVGDYYYADGTWSPTYSTSGASACIGIVFKSGAVGGDAASNYDNKLAGGVIRGYVVALTDAHADKCAWGGDNVLIGTSTNQSDFSGYSNSQKIIAKATEDGHLKPDNPVSDYPAMYYITEYKKDTPIPNSSGWYFPSTGQLAALYKAYGVIRDKLATANGLLETDDYLSSSEFDRGYPSYNVGYVSFNNGNAGYKEKDEHPCYIRAILTF